MVNNVTQILENQMNDLKEKITKIKLGIADVFIAVHRTDIKNIRSPKDMFPLFEEIDKMPNYLSELKQSESMLEILEKSRMAIEQNELMEVVSQ